MNIVEVSKYINSNVSDSNLLAMINDMIIGVPIYIKERIIGYIIVEHEFYRFFEVDTVNFKKVNDT